jgi:hypothetical protein
VVAGGHLGGELGNGVIEHTEVVGDGVGCGVARAQSGRAAIASPVTSEASMSRTTSPVPVAARNVPTKLALVILHPVVIVEP